MTITRNLLHRTKRVVAEGILILAMSVWFTPADADVSDPVAKVTSHIVSVQESGVREILERRRETIDRLIEFLRGGDRQATGATRASLESAINVLGELRAVEAADILVTYIDFFTGDRKMMHQRIRLPSEKYPAVRALVNIGRPAIPAIFRRLPELLAALQDNDNRRQLVLRNCVWVGLDIEGPEALVLHLKLALDREKDPGRRAGIEALLGVMPIRLRQHD